MDQLVFVYKGTEDEKANYDWQDKHKDGQRYSQNIQCLTIKDTKYFTNISVRWSI